MNYSERRKMNREMEFNGFLNLGKGLGIECDEEDITEFYRICNELGFRDYGDLDITFHHGYNSKIYSLDEIDRLHSIDTHEGTLLLKAFSDENIDDMEIKIIFGHHSLHMALRFAFSYGSYFEIEVLYGGLLSGNSETLYYNSDGEFDIDKVVAKLKEEMIYVAEEQIKDLEGQIKELKEVKKSNIIQLR